MNEELRMNNTTNNSIAFNARKELLGISDSASEVIEDLERALLMLSDLCHALDPIEEVYQMQTYRYASIALDYTYNALRDVTEIYKEIERMRNSQPVEPVKGD